MNRTEFTASFTLAIASTALLALVLQSIGVSKALAQDAEAGVDLTPGAPGLDLAAMDTSVSPCKDLYRFANGKWLDGAVIPNEYASNGVDLEVSLRNVSVLHSICEAAAADKGADPNSVEGKVSSFYRSGMDEKTIEAQGIQPLASELAAIDGISSTTGLESEIAHLRRIGVGAAFRFGVGSDTKNSNRVIPQLGQGGLDLPERGYYERTDKDSQAIRDAFTLHVSRVLELMGEPTDQAATDAATVMAIETRLAQSSMTPVERRDPEATYHLLDLADLNALTPGVDWSPFFDGIGLKNPGQFNVSNPAFFTTLGAMFGDVPLAQWKTYLRWTLINSESSRLSSAFVDESFSFNSTVMRGVSQKTPRWQRMVGATDRALGEALGQLYVKQAFGPDAKARALALVQNLKGVLRDDLATLPWMTDATRKHALVKLDAMAIKIGYPDHWRDYSKLDVSSLVFVVNCMRSDEFEFARSLSKIGKKPDRGEWGMTPSTVNAYYSTSDNSINFPAGILQPPYFDPHADDAVNYGSIGAVIGHEMTHGFDDQGRKFDSRGNLHNWWTDADAAAFRQRADGIAAQYSAYEPVSGVHINGRLTLGENIADIGGLKIAYLALERSLKGKPRTLIDGYTPEQRFFIAYAQSWRSVMRPQSLKVQLASDPHSPDSFRVLGATTDTPEFREAFGCPTDPNAAATTIW